MMYVPADRVHLNDPITEWADQLLLEWAWNHGHKVIVHSDGLPGKCQCGEPVNNDDEVRAHWEVMRRDQRVSAA